jgi:hypothetical protein
MLTVFDDHSHPVVIIGCQALCWMAVRLETGQVCLPALNHSRPYFNVQSSAKPLFPCLVWYYLPICRTLGSPCIPWQGVYIVTINLDGIYISAPKSQSLGTAWNMSSPI